MKNLFWKFVFQKDQCMNHRHDTNLDDDFGAGKLIRRQTSKRAPEVATKTSHITDAKFLQLL